MCETDEMNEISNICETSEDENEEDNFKDVEKRIEKFEETLHPLNDVESPNTNNSLVYAILFALRFDISDRTDICGEKEIQQTIDDNLFLKLFKNKKKFHLGHDNRKFNLHCIEINEILADFSYFLRVFELKKNWMSKFKKSKETENC